MGDWNIGDLSPGDDKYRFVTLSLRNGEIKVFWFLVIMRFLSILFFNIYGSNDNMGGEILL